VITDNEAIQRQNEAIIQENAEIQSQLHATQNELIETREALRETKEHLKVKIEAFNKTEERLKQLEEKFVRQSSTVSMHPSQKTIMKHSSSPQVESVFKTLQRMSQSFRPDFCAHGGSSGNGRPRTDPLNRDFVQNWETG
jgi:chromosome segregation ATPase